MHRFSLVITLALWFPFSISASIQDEKEIPGSAPNQIKTEQNQASKSKPQIAPQPQPIQPAEDSIVKTMVSDRRSQNPLLDKNDETTNFEIQKQDLSAQQSMATAAWLMFGAASLQIILSCVGIYFIWATLKTTHRAVAEAAGATKAARDAANAASDGVIVTRLMGDAQNRPWVSIACRLDGGFQRSTTHAGVEGYYLNLQASAHNHGRSPATNVMFRAEIGIMNSESGDLMNDFCDRYRNIPDQATETIFPDESKNLGHMLFLPQHVIDSQLASQEFKMLSPLIYGCILYKSPHTEGIRQTRFSFLLCNRREDGMTITLMPDKHDWMERAVYLTGPLAMAPD